MLYRYYKIKSLVNSYTYVGKTETSLKRRLQKHKDNLKKYLKGKSGKCGSFQIIQNGIRGIDYQIELREYREKNKAKITEQQKEYREVNKTAILEKKNQKFKCLLCDGRYTRSHKAEHNKTEKHQAAVRMMSC